MASETLDCPVIGAGPAGMHNGQVGGWPAVRRHVDAMIPDDLYASRAGATDSEAIFLAVRAQGMEQDPVGALVATLVRAKAAMHAEGVAAPLRLAAVLTDGGSLWAFRWACDARPPSLHWREEAGGLVVASKPIDSTCWQKVPCGACLVVGRVSPHGRSHQSAMHWPGPPETATSARGRRDRRSISTEHVYRL